MQQERDPFEMMDKIREAKSANDFFNQQKAQVEQFDKQQLTQTEIQQPQKEIGGMIGDVYTFTVWVTLLIPMIVAVVVSIVFAIGYKDAKFVNGVKSVIRSIWEFVKYIVIPNEKGLNFVDKVIATPIMRLELFGLNSGFVKIGEIFNNYFQHVYKHKNHGVEESVNPHLEEVARVISSFQTKQFILHATRALISVELLYLFATNLFTIPFAWLMSYAGGVFGLVSETQKDLMLYAMSALAVLSVVMAWAYIRKIIDDILYIMQTQQDVNNEGFREFVKDNLSIITRHAYGIDGELAKEAESYTLATFFSAKK